MITAEPAFDLTSSAKNDQAALYFGHLITRAENALPNRDRMSQVCLCWAAAHVIADGARKWSIKLEGIESKGQHIGTMGLVARLSKGAPEHIELARRAWLISDGREILTLLTGFQNDTETTVHVTTQAIEMASLSVILTLADLRSEISITDRYGRKVSFKKQTSTRDVVKNLPIFGSIISRL
jgi:hypothetical protein